LTYPAFQGYIPGYIKKPLGYEMLTDTAIKAALRAAKAAQKPIKRFDQGGLFLLATAAGGGLWRFKYQFDGREKLIGLGRFPDVTLKQARERRDDARHQVADGLDPSSARQAKKAALADSVEAIAREWLGQQKDLEPDTIRAHTQRLEDYVFPRIGSRPIGSIEPADLLATLRRIEARGTYDTASRTMALCGRVWRFAVATGRAKRDISRDLQGALASVESKNHAAIVDPAGVGGLLRALDTYVGQPAVCYALKLAPMLFVRPGELRAAEWSEFNLDAANPEWRIPAGRMKMRDPHIVPLATQAVLLLRELQPISTGRLLFPGLRTAARPMSENTVNAALRRLGFTGDMQTGHGFRTIASTMLNELGWNSDLIELQLSHRERNKVRAAYNRAQRLDERRRMMQAWADHLDVLRADGGNKVSPIKRAVAAA
jgi:integrase